MVAKSVEASEMPVISQAVDALMPSITEKTNSQTNISLSGKTKDLKFGTSDENHKAENCSAQREACAASHNDGNSMKEMQMAKNDKNFSLFHIQDEVANDDGNSITLIYRKYKLASTPESTV
ncbi:unnamed protein product [Gongylonema pulchrum]|uniref:Ovule protein n=1 Tax=Gongylonema pulchrum TaxID=637853 RepID=A0A183E142_9BILA|nr:unnamed protein product [Gongylonema pulchrum]